MLPSREDRAAWSAQAMDRQKAELMASDAVQQLLASDVYSGVMATLERRNRRRRPKLALPPAGLHEWLFAVVTMALADPDLAETMTKAERRALSEKIRGHCNALAELMEPFKRSDSWVMDGPFPAFFDRLAKEVAARQPLICRAPANEMRDTQYDRRHAMYRLLTEDLGMVLRAISEGAEEFAEQETLIKKPRDRNVKRLYFLRQLTSQMVQEFGSPCRAVVLSLASVYFDCSDLDEAAVSKLAPVDKHLIEGFNRDTLEFLIEDAEEQYLAETDPEAKEEIADSLNHWRGLLEKSSG